MKKTIIIILIPILMILFSVIGLLRTKNTTNREIRQANMQYEYYLNKTIYGTEVTTIINKAINENEKNNIQKNERNHYIENNTNSIKIELKMTTNGKTYQMEEMYNNDITRFVENFNIIKFKCIRNRIP